MLQIFEFFIEGGDQEKSHVLLHITEPNDSPEEKDKGHFFAVAEINNGSVDQIEHLQQMIDDLESGYYETADEKNKSAFELTLEYINRRGHYILNKNQAELSCLVGVINKEKIAFSFYGEPIVKMLYGKQEGFEIMNILQGEKHNKKDKQLFSAVMEGKINEGDFFFISTPHVTDDISDKQLINILPSKGAQNSVNYIQDILKSSTDNLSYGGIVIHYPTSRVISAITETTEEEKETENEIIEENQTIAKETIEKTTNRHTSENRPKETQTSSETNYRPREIYDEPLVNVILITVGRSLVTGITGIYRLIKKIITIIGKSIIGLFLLITNFGGQRSTVVQAFNETIHKQKTYLKNLPIFSKILFVLTILLALGFLGSVSYLKIKSGLEAKQKSYNNAIQAIVDKKTAAEASMIYDDEAKAFELLKEAEDMLIKLPAKTSAQKNKVAELQADIKESLKILQKMNVIKPELIADLVQTQSSAKTTRLALINKDLIAYGPEDLFAYKVNLNTKEINKKEHQAIPYLYASDTPKEQDVVVFLTQENNIAEYLPKSETFSSKDITLLPNSTLSDIFVYSQKLYAIDTANSQIFKHSKTQTGYDKGSAWIKSENIDLSDAVSLAIDGDLFVLKQNGIVLKFVSGVVQNFNITGLEPALNKPSEIWTYSNVKNIYILEPTNKRVIILDKQGKLLQQYTANEWLSPTGMIVDEPSKVIYILDNDKIYRFGIE